MVRGYAAVDAKGEVLVDTVASDRQASMMAWLVGHADFKIPEGMGGFAILEHFAKRAEQLGVIVVPVEVTIVSG